MININFSLNEIFMHLVYLYLILRLICHIEHKKFIQREININHAMYFYLKYPKFCIFKLEPIKVFFFVFIFFSVNF